MFHGKNVWDEDDLERIKPGALLLPTTRSLVDEIIFILGSSHDNALPWWSDGLSPGTYKNNIVLSICPDQLLVTHFTAALGDTLFEIHD